MAMGTRAKQVSIYINEGDEWQNNYLHIEILLMLRNEGIAGATVVRALEGFTGNIYPGNKLPVVIQFVDSEDNVVRVLPRLREMAPTRLITLQDVDIAS